MSRPRPLLVLIVLFALGGCGGRSLPGLEELGPGRPREGLRYEVTVVGEGLDGGLRDHLLEASAAARSTDQPPANELILRRRAEADIPRLEAALRARGYYDATVRLRLERVAQPSPGAPPAADGSVSEPGAALLPAPPDWRVIFEVRPGPLYRIGERRIEIVGPADGFEPPGPADLGLKQDLPAEAARILEAERQLLDAALRSGHARAAPGKRRLVVDHRTRRMDVTLAIEPGPVCSFGEIRFEGIEGIDPGFLRDLVAIRPGERFDPAKLDAARRALLESQLFSVVRVETAEPVDGNRLPVEVRVEQRPHRSVGGAAGFTTDEGPRVRGFWEHRNLFGAAERLRLDTQISPVLHETRAQFRKPHFLSRRQDLIADGAVRFENTDTFESRSVRAGAGIERRPAPGVTGALGVAWRLSDVREGDEQNLFALLSVPGSLRVDRSDSLLDPSTGWRLSLEAAPFLDTLGPSRRFFRSRVTHTRYFRIWNEPRFVIALRGSAGTIFGVERDQVPADERFYAGGGGSVRGIPFRKAGPLDAGRDPLGGRSLLEGSVELRLRPQPEWGVVAFFDAGGVFTSVLPDPREETLRFGTGLGLRYVTPIGPLRFDVGVPVDPRRDVDDPLQFYISLGQAF